VKHCASSAVADGALHRSRSIEISAFRHGDDMAKSPRSLSEIEAWDPESGDLQVVIETPKDSRNKFAYDPGIGAFRLRGILPEGSVFPFDFGFVPSTLGEDGDPLDVLVLLDAGVGRGVCPDGATAGRHRG
jgi:inorganic pyrophosphatase